MAKKIIKTIPAKKATTKPVKGESQTPNVPEVVLRFKAETIKKEPGQKVPKLNSKETKMGIAKGKGYDNNYTKAISEEEQLARMIEIEKIPRQRFQNTPKRRERERMANKRK